MSLTCIGREDFHIKDLAPDGQDVEVTIIFGRTGKFIHFEIYTDRYLSLTGQPGEALPASPKAVRVGARTCLI